MNKALLLIAWTMAAATGGLAQVTVDVVLEQEQFLRSESFPVKIRVANSSGQTLRLGDGTNWLAFEIEDYAGHAVRRLGPVPLIGPFTLESSKVASLQTDLMPYFDLNEIGRYSVSVAVQVPQLERAFSSPPRSFYIISGTKLWERDFSAPASGVMEVRKYALVQATLLKQLRLYARVTDASEQQVIRVLPLGQLVSFSKPEAQLDRSSSLHVLFQSSARAFLYEVVAPDGELIIRQTYEYADSRPILRTSEEKGIYVVGGRRRFVLTDVPPSLPDDPGLPAPSTNAFPPTPKKGK